MKRILSFLLIFTMTFSLFSIPSYASSESDNEESDSSFWTECKNYMGLAFAGLGYVLEGETINGTDFTLISNCLNGIANFCFTDEKKAEISHWYGYEDWATMQEDDSKDWSEVYWEAILEQELIINDTQAKQLKVSQSVADAIQEYMSTEYVPSYFLLHVPYFGDFPNGNAGQASVIESYYNSASENNTLLGVYQAYLDERYLTIDLCAPTCIDNTVLACPNDETYLDLLKNSDSYYNQFRRNANVTNNFSYSIYCYDSRTFAYNYLVQPSKRVNTNGTTSYVPPEGYPFCDSSKSINNSSYYYSIRFYSASRSSTSYFVANHDIYIPLFRNVAEARLYSSGDSDIYMYPSGYSGGELTVSTDLDYDALNKEIRNAIKKSGLTSPMDIQRVINTTVTEWLKKIEHNTDDIVDNTKETNQILNKILDSMKEGFNNTKSGLTNIKTSINDSVTELKSIVKSLSDIFNFLKDMNFNSVPPLDETTNPGNSVLNTYITVQFEEVIGKDEDGNDIVESVAINNDIQGFIRDIQNSKFPFSLMNDVRAIFNMFKAEPPDVPKIHIQLAGSAPAAPEDSDVILLSLSDDSSGFENLDSPDNIYSLGNIGFDIDFTFIDPIMPFVRAIEIIIFLLTLIVLTRNFVSFMGDFL